MSRFGAAAGLKLAAAERCPHGLQRDGQALKVLGTDTYAVLVVASGSQAVMPQKALLERGYKGRIYRTYSAVDADLLRMVGGHVGLSGPAVAADQLPDSHP